MEKRLAKSVYSTCSILAATLALMCLELVLIVRDFFSGLRCLFQSLLRILRKTRRALSGWRRSKNLALKGPQGQLFQSHEPPIEGILDGESVDEVKLSRMEVMQVMERLGISSNPEGDDGLQEDVGASQLVRLFHEREPSSAEVKKAFHMFDKNCDGFIDARELHRFLYTFGFMQISEDDCRDMIRAFNDNGDRVINLREFTKLVEKSLQ